MPIQRGAGYQGADECKYTKCRNHHRIQIFQPECEAAEILPLQHKLLDCPCQGAQSKTVEVCPVLRDLRRTRQTTSSAVKANKAVVGINGSAFDYNTGRPGFDAVMIKDGKIYNKAAGTSYSLMAVRQDGMMYTPEQGLSANQLVRSG